MWCYNEGLEGGYYIQPTVFKGNNQMRIFQEEIFGPVVCIATFKTEEEAIAIANDTLYGLGAGYGRATCILPIKYRVPFRQEGCGLTVIMPIRRMPHLADIKNLASAGNPQDDAQSLPPNQNMLISYNKNKLGFFSA